MINTLSSLATYPGNRLPQSTSLFCLCFAFSCVSLTHNPIRFLSSHVFCMSE